MSRRRRRDRVRRPQLGVDAEHRLDVERPADDERNIAYTRSFWDCAAGSDRKTYFNFPGLFDCAAAVQASYGSNHERLARVKATYDPDNRFRLNQNIRPALEILPDGRLAA